VPGEPRCHEADPRGVIARFVAGASVCSSAASVYLAWRWSLRGGLEPAVAAAIVLEATIDGRHRAGAAELRRLLERTRGHTRLAVNDNPASEED